MGSLDVLERLGMNLDWHMHRTKSIGPNFKLAHYRISSYDRGGAATRCRKFVGGRLS
jgi:hypothetical protein